MAKWTAKPPKKMGYYWAYENLDIEDADVALIYVPRGCETCYYANAIWEISHFSHYIGPLEIPATPFE